MILVIVLIAMLANALVVKLGRVAVLAGYSGIHVDY